MTTELSVSEVVERVRAYVDRVQVGDISLSVDEEGVRLQNGYWRVPVRPAREPEPLFAYYEALAELEDAVQTTEGLNVTIASGDPLCACDPVPSTPNPVRKSGLLSSPNLTPQQVADRVRPYVARLNVDGTTVRMDETSIRLADGLWRLRVRPSREPISKYHYIDALVDLQTEVEEKEGIGLDIVPGRSHSV